MQEPTASLWVEFRLHSLGVLVSDPLIVCDGGPHGEPVPHSAIGLTTGFGGKGSVSGERPYLPLPYQKKKHRKENVLD